MERSYLIELLQTLSPEELQDFALYISGPQFRKKRQFEEMQLLFDAILVSYLGDADKTLNKQTIYYMVFPGSEFVEGKLEKLMVELNKLLRQYLLTEYYFRPDNEVQTQLDMIKILELRGLEAKKAQAIQKLARQQVSTSKKGTEYFYHQSRLERAIHDHETKYNQLKSDLNIPNVVQNIDVFHYLNRLEMLNRFLIQQRPAQLDVEEPVRLALEESIVPQRYLDYSTELQIRYKVFLLLREDLPTKKSFEELLELLRENRSKLAEDTVKESYTYLRNFCVMIINNGNTDLLPVLHAIQRDNLENGDFYYQGKLSPSSFISMVVAAIRVKEFDWLEQFLEIHQDKIIGDNESRDLYRMNKALYLFAMQQFEQALDLLPEKIDEVVYHLMARRLEIKIYYETQSELLQYKLDALKMYISRASKKFLSDNLRKRNADFVNLLYQIMQSPPGDSARSVRLRQRIEDKKWTADRDWLLEKVAELA